MKNNFSPKNQNYAAVVVEIKTLLPLNNCNNVQAAIIMGNQVIVSKEVKIGDIGLYFPLETQLSEIYLKNNNLYRKPELNLDSLQKGYFEENGRIRCVKFRGHKSEGLFMPIQSLSFINLPGSRLSNSITSFKIGNDNIFIFGTTELKINDVFDEFEGVEICRKYVVKHNITHGVSEGKKSKSFKQFENKLVENQFRFHQDTSMLFRNLDRINPNSLIQISFKIHGTSFISSKILCLKPLKWYEKLLKKLGINIVDTHYDYVFSSRKVIKNKELNPNKQDYYSEDIWKIAHEEVKEFLQDGLTFYGEIAGYLPNGGAIQKDYDYGCNYSGEHKIYIYRITYTNPSGKVFEFSAKQVQDFCSKNGLNAVPQLYYGYAKFLGPYPECNGNGEENWRDAFLEYIKQQYNEKDCYICSNKIPEEGVVIRIEGTEFEAYKAKSNRFYERETALLDKGEIDIEENNI